jgi:hypothetical protein
MNFFMSLQKSHVPTISKVKLDNIENPTRIHDAMKENSYLFIF